MPPQLVDDVFAPALSANKATKVVGTGKDKAYIFFNFARVQDIPDSVSKTFLLDQTAHEAATSDLPARGGWAKGTAELATAGKTGKQRWWRCRALTLMVVLLQFKLVYLVLDDPV